MSPSDTYPHDISAEFIDPLRALYHPPDVASELDEIETRKKIFVDKKVTKTVTLG